MFQTCVTLVSRIFKPPLNPVHLQRILEWAQHGALRRARVLFDSATLNTFYACDAHSYKSIMPIALELGPVLVVGDLLLHLLQHVVEPRAHSAAVTCCNMRSHAEAAKSASRAASTGASLVLSSAVGAVSFRFLCFWPVRAPQLRGMLLRQNGTQHALNFHVACTAFEYEHASGADTCSYAGRGAPA